MIAYTRLAFCLFLIAGVLLYSHSHVCASSADVPYYPLAKGYSWKYQVYVSGRRTSSTVEWRVTSADNTKDGVVFQVWQFPSQSDDEAMNLHVSKEGIEEISTGTVILKYPSVTGDRWATTKPTHRVFRVISAGHPCHVGKITSEDCISVEDQDEALKFRTVTTYAKGIGPIKYMYFKKGSASDIPTQTVELISAHLAPK